MTNNNDQLEGRILVYAPGGKDAQIASKVFAAAQINSFICHTFPELLSELDKGAGAVLTIEEVLAAGALTPLSQYISNQPTWSDIPILMLTQHGADSISIGDAVDHLGNLTLLERPVRTATLISAIRAALRARVKQYQVREADQRKDEFLASLGHELRNPLAPIRTSMSILKHMYPAASGVTEICSVVERQITHLTRLVDDLLDVARITNGKVVLHRERTTLSGIISHAVEICTPLLAASGHEILVSQPDETIQLDADSVRLVQSVANILANAIKYTVTPGKIFLTARVAQNNIIFSVRDNGIGLEQEALSRIFDMFAQSNPVPGRTLGGLGIGLSLAKRFAEMHGGSICAKSEGLGRGSEFTLTLPVVVRSDENHESTGQTTAPLPVSAAESRQILVVDDNRDGADMLQMLLETSGYIVVTAYDGHEAIAAAQKIKPDVVVMDIGLPGMDGYEAVRQIKQQAGDKEILAIAMTGWGQENVKRLAAEAGFDHHLVKPVDFKVLQGLLERNQR